MKTRADYEQRVLRAERFVEDRLDEEVTPAEVARVPTPLPSPFSGPLLPRSAMGGQPGRAIH